MRTGDTVEGQIRAPKDCERYFALLKVDSINLEDPDPELDLDFVPEPREAKVDYALSNSFAFGGHNAVLVFKRV